MLVALCTTADVLLIPGMSNTAAVPSAWLAALVTAADRACKIFCKQNLELQSLVEYYSGDGTQNIVIRQLPLWQGQTTATAGQTLPTGTINVASTAGFCPSTSVSNPSTQPPTIAVQTGTNSWSAVTYTGTTSTSFTGCSGGTGTIPAAPYNNVFAPVVWYDPLGYGGQNPGQFADGTILPKGTTWMAEVDSGGQLSNRGTIKRVGGAGSAFFLGWPAGPYFQGKLGGYRLPGWPRDNPGNIKVAYSSGYYPIPADLTNACAKLVAYMARNDPQGANLSSENLGNYSYNVLTNTSPDVMPEIGSIIGVLKRYRDWSLGT